MKIASLAFGLILPLALGLPLTASAHDCIAYADHIHWLGAASTGNYTNDVAVSGNLACVAETREFGALARFSVIDISNPQDPQALSTLDLGLVGANGVAVTGSLAFVAVHGLVARSKIVDFSNPAAPVVQGTLLEAANDCAIAGIRLYLVNDHQLRIMDITTPTSPQPLGTAFGVRGHAVAVSGNYAYIADESFGLRIVDVTNPAAPLLRGTLPLAGGAYDVAISGSLALIAAGDAGMIVADVSNPIAPAIVGNSSEIGWKSGVAITGATAILTGSGLHTLDISNPAQPVVTGKVAVAGRRLVLDGDKAYVAAQLGGLAVVDVASPDSPDLLGNLATAPPRRIAVRGTLALVLEDAALALVDLGTVIPTLVAHVPIAGGTAIAIQDDFAFVSAGSAGLYVVDFHDPSNASLIASLDTPDFANDVAIAGDLAVVADGNGYLRLIDVSNPWAPATLGVAPVNAVQVSVSGAQAYVSDLSDAIQVVDISIPAAPAVLGSVGLTLVTDLAAVDHFVFAIRQGLTVVDFENPAAPVVAATLPMPAMARAIALAGDVAYVAGDGFVQLVDISNPTAPEQLGGSYEFDQAVDVALGADAIVIADQGYGLYVLPAECGATTSLPAPAAAPLISALTMAPNPMRSSLELRFTLGAAGPVTLDVYDVHGRKVRRLLDDAADSGEHRISWDGRGDRGERAPSGVYWVRLDGSGIEQTRPVTLLR